MAMVAGLMFLSCSAEAFDGQKPGFIMGFGCGPGYVIEDVTRFSHLLGVVTDLKIGYAFSDRFLLFYNGRQFWTESSDRFYTVAYPSVGSIYFLRDASPALFLSGGVGISLGVVENGSTFGGLSGQCGIGYEFGRHAYVELNLVATHTFRGSVYNMALTLNILGY
jgi:hypothetical protein